MRIQSLIDGQPLCGQPTDWPVTSTYQSQKTSLKPARKALIGTLQWECKYELTMSSLVLSLPTDWIQDWAHICSRDICGFTSRTGLNKDSEDGTWTEWKGFSVLTVFPSLSVSFLNNTRESNVHSWRYCGNRTHKATHKHKLPSQWTASPELSQDWRNFITRLTSLVQYLVIL